jgi:hypothetical protein
MGLSPKDALSCARDMAIALVRGNFKVVSMGSSGSSGSARRVDPLDLATVSDGAGYFEYDSDPEVVEDLLPEMMAEADGQVAASHLTSQSPTVESVGVSQFQVLAELILASASPTSLPAVVTA